MSGVLFVCFLPVLDRLNKNLVQFIPQCDFKSAVLGAFKLLECFMGALAYFLFPQHPFH